MEKEKLLEKLNGLDFKKCTTDDSYRALCEIGKEIDVYDFSGRFIRFNNLDNIVRTTLDEYGVRGVKAALDGVTDLSHEFYYKDDDGKIRNVNENDLELWRYELKVCIEELWQELQEKRKHENKENQIDKEKLLMLIAEYTKKHPLAKELGGEYIYQDDEAQENAIELVANIFENCF